MRQSILNNLTPENVLKTEIYYLLSAYINVNVVYFETN